MIGDASLERMSVVHVEVQRLPESAHASGQLQNRRQRHFHRSLDVRYEIRQDRISGTESTDITFWMLAPESSAGLPDADMADVDAHANSFH